MAELPIAPIGKIIKSTDNTELSGRDIDILLKILNEKKAHSLKEKNEIKVFICYSAEDERVGVKIKDMLANLEIKSFLASDSLCSSGRWEKQIIAALKDADVFIAVLSNSFKNSDYCSQVLGIAYFGDIFIIPLSLNNVMPYGFISSIVSARINRYTIPLEALLEPISHKFPEINIAQKLINALKEANSFRSADTLMRNLRPYFNKLNGEEINKVIDYSIENNQIWGSDLCRTKYLPKFIRLNKTKIENHKLEEILEIIKEDKIIKRNNSVNSKQLNQENEKVEFKSTLRWDIRQNRVNKELDKVIAKSIAGFLNTDGGTLYIGISDDGSVYGIEQDIKNAPNKNEDGFRLQLVEIIKSNLGAAFTKYIHVNIEKRESKKVCVVKVDPSPKPVFCGKEQIFYIRADNSTAPLSPKEMLEYKEMHWDNQPVLDKKLIKDKKLVFECGNKPGAGRYMCTSCGKTLTLDASIDVLPPCSSCSGCKFKRI